jgi:hypothetical protein
MPSLSERLLPGVPIVESLLFAASVDDLGLTNQERDVACQLNENGFAVLDFPDDDLDARIDRIRADLAPRYDFDLWREAQWARGSGLRIQDAWAFNDDVRAIAANAAVIELLTKIYGRRAFPFQTLNFPVGTQQHFHSDSIHFSSVPERFMCGVWLAMEDVHPDAGPLVYYPGSHRWPVLTNDMVGRRIGGLRGGLAQEPYEPAWEAMVEAMGVQPQSFLPRKGQALIWAANLLHGGGRHADPARTRWSQVTHYYFEGCAYYTPAFSDPLLGNLDLRAIQDIGSGRAMPNLYVGEPIEPLLNGGVEVFRPELPGDFEPALYLELNPDVPRGAGEAEAHYLNHGFHEKRRYR